MLIKYNVALSKEQTRRKKIDCGLMFDLSEGAGRHGNIKWPLLSVYAEETGAIQGGFSFASDLTASSQE